MFFVFMAFSDSGGTLGSGFSLYPSWLPFLHLLPSATPSVGAPLKVPVACCKGCLRACLLVVRGQQPTCGLNSLWFLHLEFSTKPAKNQYAFFCLFWAPPPFFFSLIHTQDWFSKTFMKWLLKSVFVCVHAQAGETVKPWFSYKPQYEQGISRILRPNAKQKSKNDF